MAEITVTLKNNLPEVLAMSEEAKQVALNEIGLAAEGYSKRLCPVDTGRLRNSISYATATGSGTGDDPLATPEDDAVYLGTNVEYAVYQEFGTGVYADDGKGRKTPWWYQDEKGNWHHTSGTKPKHFIRLAISGYVGEYKELVTKVFQRMMNRNT